MTDRERTSALHGIKSVPSLPKDRSQFAYYWPSSDELDAAAWNATPGDPLIFRQMPETTSDLAADSRWPAMFPSAVCLVTARVGDEIILEKVVGASIINRFPYALALSFCRQHLSDRHHVRSKSMEIIERSATVAVQFIMPGPQLTRVLRAISDTSQDQMVERLAAAHVVAGVNSEAPISKAPILGDAYLVYEAELVRPSRDLDRNAVNNSAWIDCGSHRIYKFEIRNIALDREIAAGRSPLHWRALPVWRNGPAGNAESKAHVNGKRQVHWDQVNYKKEYRADYSFPTRETVAFDGVPSVGKFPRQFDVLRIDSLPEGKLEVSDDSARWPCFFPSSLGLITSRAPDGRAAAFPCGSTAVVARAPMTIAIAVSYAQINERYAPRASLKILQDAGRFICGVPIYQREVLDAIAYLGNVSLRTDPNKVENCGLTRMDIGSGFGFRELPIHFDCKIVTEERLGTHLLFLGEVERIFVDRRVHKGAPLEWCPWAGATPPELLATT